MSPAPASIKKRIFGIRELMRPSHTAVTIGSSAKAAVVTPTVTGPASKEISL